MTQFHSCLRTQIEEFLQIRKQCYSASEYAHDKQVMEHFDRYLVERGIFCKDLSEQDLMGWISTLSGKSNTIANKIMIIRVFINYLSGYGIHAYVPRIPKVHEDYVPYIFTEQEMQKIFEESDSLQKGNAYVNPMIHLQMSMILRLMYGCGLRIGETLQLRMGDVNLEQGVLTLRKTKGAKHRLVPMHESLTQILSQYCIARGFLGRPEMLLFETKDTAIPTAPVDARHRFIRILAAAGISTVKNHPHERGPCLHCLRHVFVFRSFSSLEQHGVSTSDTYPYLSVFLGHDSMQETEKYLKFSSDMYPEAGEMFENFTQDIFPEVDNEK